MTAITRVEHGFRLSAGPRGMQYMAVEICDTGPGLDEETRERMFSPLFSRAEGGHGMCLAIAQSIVTAHDGIVRADNRSGGGAKLVVLLPITSDDSQQRKNHHGND